MKEGMVTISGYHINLGIAWRKNK